MNPMDDFIYWRHPTPPGIKVEEVSGGERYSGTLWLEMARQLYCENGKETYREIGHFHNGSPFLYGEECRISVTHCHGLLAVATLPATPEVTLDKFTPRAALGIDAERADRNQVLKVRERFLSQRELDMISADDVESNVVAWTVKEAVYKAALTEGLDLRDGIAINRMPIPGPATPIFDPTEFGLPKGTTKLPDSFFGEAESCGESFILYTYRSDDFIVTLAYSRKSAKFGKTI